MPHVSQEDSAANSEPSFDNQKFCAMTQIILKYAEEMTLCGDEMSCLTLRMSAGCHSVPCHSPHRMEKPVQAPEPDAPWNKLGEYRIVRDIAEGTFGMVKGKMKTQLYAHEWLKPP